MDNPGEDSTLQGSSTTDSSGYQSVPSSYHFVSPDRFSFNELSTALSSLDTDPPMVGNVFAFCYVNHNPIFTIGPHCKSRETLTAIQGATTSR